MSVSTQLFWRRPLSVDLQNLAFLVSCIIFPFITKVFVEDSLHSPYLLFDLQPIAVIFFIFLFSFVKNLVMHRCGCHGRVHLPMNRLPFLLLEERFLIWNFCVLTVVYYPRTNLPNPGIIAFIIQIFITNFGLFLLLDVTLVSAWHLLQ